MIPALVVVVRNIKNAVVNRSVKVKMNLEMIPVIRERIKEVEKTTFSLGEYL